MSLRLLLFSLSLSLSPISITPSSLFPPVIDKNPAVRVPQLRIKNEKKKSLTKTKKIYKLFFTSFTVDAIYHLHPSPASPRLSLHHPLPPIQHSLASLSTIWRMKDPSTTCPLRLCVPFSALVYCPSTFCSRCNFIYFYILLKAFFISLTRFASLYKHTHTHTHTYTYFFLLDTIFSIF